MGRQQAEASLGVCYCQEAVHRNLHPALWLTAIYVQWNDICSTHFIESIECLLTLKYSARLTGLLFMNSTSLRCDLCPVGSHCSKVAFGEPLSPTEACAHLLTWALGKRWLREGRAVGFQQWRKRNCQASEASPTVAELTGHHKSEHVSQTGVLERFLVLTLWPVRCCAWASWWSCENHGPLPYSGSRGRVWGGD